MTSLEDSVIDKLNHFHITNIPCNICIVNPRQCVNRYMSYHIKNMIDFDDLTCASLLNEESIMYPDNIILYSMLFSRSSFMYEFITTSMPSEETVINALQRGLKCDRFEYLIDNDLIVTSNIVNIASQYNINCLEVIFDRDTYIPTVENMNYMTDESLELCHNYFGLTI